MTSNELLTPSTHRGPWRVGFHSFGTLLSAVVTASFALQWFLQHVQRIGINLPALKWIDSFSAVCALAALSLLVGYALRFGLGGRQRERNHASDGQDRANSHR
jgi:hypothetical protein